MKTTTTRAPKRAIPPDPPSSGSKPAEEEQGVGWNRVLEIARRRLNQFVTLEPKVLQGNAPEAIHDFRVASRRLQQVLDLLYSTPRPNRIRKLRRAIQRARRTFSTVRNCDVLIQRVEGSLGRKRAGQRESWRAFKDYLEKRRSESFQEAVGKLSELNLSAFYVRLRDCLNATPKPRGNAPVAISEDSQPGTGVEIGQFQAQVVRALQESWETLEAQVSNSQIEDEPRSLHPARIAAKRLRYLIEVIHEFGVPDTDKILARLRRLQQHLGDWHDLEVMEQMMAEMLARPAFLRRNIELAMRIERLMLRNQKMKKVYEKRYLEATMDSAGWSRLKVWVGNLSSKAPLIVARNRE